MNPTLTPYKLTASHALKPTQIISPTSSPRPVTIPNQPHTQLHYDIKHRLIPHQAKLATRRGSRAAAVGGSDAGDTVRARAAAIDEWMPEKFKFPAAVWRRR